MLIKKMKIIEENVVYCDNNYNEERENKRDDEEECLNNKIKRERRTNINKEDE